MSLDRACRGIIIAFSLLPWARGAVAQVAQAAAGIKDNSFLIEEAYNQEAGVVQHISSFTRPMSGSGWAFSFTQEWPAPSMRHQFSYTVPVTDAGGAGVGDIALNYRFQAKGMDGGAAFAPRLSLLLPTGDESKGMGSGGLGVQTNLPVSIALSPVFTMHANFGFTRTQDGKDALGADASFTTISLGGSLIWLTSSTFNVLLEGVMANTTTSTAFLNSVAASSFIAPGVRSAINLPDGMQIVPGLAFVKGVGDSKGSDSWFLYFSVEHAFRRQATRASP